MWLKFYLLINWSYYVQLALEMITSPLGKKILVCFIIHNEDLSPGLPKKIEDWW